VGKKSQAIKSGGCRGKSNGRKTLFRESARGESRIERSQLVKMGQEGKGITERTPLGKATH